LCLLIIIIIIIHTYIIYRAPWCYSFRATGGQVKTISQKQNKKVLSLALNNVNRLAAMDNYSTIDIPHIQVSGQMNVSGIALYRQVYSMTIPQHTSGRLMQRELSSQCVNGRHIDHTQIATQVPTQGHVDCILLRQWQLQTDNVWQDMLQSGV